MAARIRTKHQDEVRARIQASVLIGLLESHAMGETELSASRIRAIELLLKKSIPDLQSVEITGDSDAPVTHVIKWAGNGNRSSD
jgi:hypothetical protein